MPDYYPAFIDVRNRYCVVIGGGAIGEEKVEKLLDCHAEVTVISPVVTEKVESLASEGTITWIPREYATGDLSDAFIAIAATNDSEVNQNISSEASSRNVLLNVVDVTHLCTFIAPAVATRGQVTIAASTSGASPALARKFRELLNGSPVEAKHGLMDYAALAPLLGDVSSHLRSQNIALFNDHWQSCITDELVEMVLKNQYEEARAILLSDLLKGTKCECKNGVSDLWEDKKALS